MTCLKLAFFFKKVDEYEKLGAECEEEEEDDSTELMQNFINYTNYLLKMLKSLSEIIQIINEFDFKKSKNSMYSTLMQNFDSILTDTISIQIINQNNNQTMSLLEDESVNLLLNESCIVIKNKSKNEYVDRLIDAFKSLKISLKTFFKNIN